MSEAKELVTCLKDGVRDLEARAEAAEADARRYRWLRQDDGCKQQNLFNLWAGVDLDAAIDAELAKEGKP